MHLRLNRKSQLPIHVQLKAQLAHLIQTGAWSPGRKLPTVRQLAALLRINRNTTSRVFAELQRDGYLSCQRGRGTYVSPPRSQAAGARARELLLVLDEALGRARRLGFSPAAFATALYARAHAAGGAAAGVGRPPVLVVECDRLRLARLRRELARSLPVRVDAVLARDLERLVQRHPRVLGRYRLVVTTVFHVLGVRRLLRRTGSEVVGLPAGDLLRRRLGHTPLVDGAGIEILRRRLAAHARRAGS